MIYSRFYNSNWYVFSHPDGNRLCVWYADDIGTNGRVRDVHMTIEQVKKFLDRPDWDLWRCDIPVYWQKSLFIHLKQALRAMEFGHEDS